MWLARARRAAERLAPPLAFACGACTQGEGQGAIDGTLDVPQCWTGPFSLNPDFFAAVPYRNTLTVRLQSGSDFESFADGVQIQMYDTTLLHPDLSRGFAGRLDQAIAVRLPPEVTPPGVPIVPDAEPLLVSMFLYLQRSCQTLNSALYAVKQVRLPTDGTCTAPTLQGADPRADCDPQRASPSGLGDGQSFVTFKSIFNGRVDEPTASERKTEGCFDVYLTDPRETSPDGTELPPCRGHIKGNFSFLFERGRPSQPFP